MGLISLIFLIFSLLSSAVFGEEDPQGIVVYSLDTSSVSLVYLVLLHSGCQHPPSLLLAQEGSNDTGKMTCAQIWTACHLESQIWETGAEEKERSLSNC